MMVMLPVIVLLEPRMPWLPLTQLLVNIRSPVWFMAFAFTVAHEPQPEKTFFVMVRYREPSSS